MLSANAKTRGRVLLVAAAVLWSTSGLFVKSEPLRTLSGPALAGFRALFAAACLVPFVRRRHIRWRPMLVPMAGWFAVMNVLFLTAMTQTTAAATVFLQYTSAVWAFVFGAVFLRERIDRGNAVALVSAVLGIAWIVLSERQPQHALANWLALGSGVCFAAVIVCLRWLRDEDSVWLVTLNHAASCLLLLPWAVPAAPGLTPVQWFLLAGLGVVQIGVPYVLFAHGIRHVTAQEAALIPLLEPILNPVWVWLVWGEPVAGPVLLGGALIVGGLAAKYLVSGEW